MRIRGHRIVLPQVVLAVLFVTIVGGIVVGGATSTAAFGTYTPTWEGTGELRTIAEESGSEPIVATNTSTYGNHGNDTVAVVLAPNQEYDDSDTERIVAFLERGGTLLVADQNGTGNELLSALDVSARFDGTPVRDERHYYRSPALVEATNVSEHRLTEGVDSLTLNHGTVLESGDATVLVATSEFAYLDTNRNEALDDDEELRSRPVAAVESAENGRVIVVSDPSAFIDVMSERPGNERFVSNVFETNETIVFDTSHSGGVPPLVGLLLLIRGSSFLQFGLLGVGLLGLAVWAVRQSRRQRETSSGNEPSRVGDGRDPPVDVLVAVMRRRYPEFEAERLRRLTEGVLRTRRQRRDNE